MPTRFKNLLWLPADALQWYFDLIIDGHPLARIAVNLLLSAFGWVIFVVLHQIF